MSPLLVLKAYSKALLADEDLKEAFMAIVKMTLEEALKLKGTTDWDAVNALSDEQIIEAAKNDPDSALLSEAELIEFKRVRKIPG